MLRGFALCGILVANVQPIAGTGDGTPVVGSSGSGVGWTELFVDQRFFPVFSLLFGVGFSLLLRSAGDRVARPRLLLLRRLLVLLSIGLLHHLLWPGDILTVYALVGVVVLLPSSWLPRWAVAVLAAAFVTASVVVAGGHFSLVPGLFLLGSALTRYGVVDRLTDSVGVPAGLAVLLGAVAVPVTLLQTRVQDDAVSHRAYMVAGLLVAGTYVCVLLLLLRTPLRPALTAVFAPLGRMALTNYLTASVFVRAVGLLLERPAGSWSTATVLTVAGGILAVQCLWSACWLRRFQYGPVEWLWRFATWLRRPPMHRVRSPAPLPPAH